jgi:pimeloyl-ACP methyl ester carboxylesterase
VQGQVEELHCTLAEHSSRPVTLIGHSWGAWLSILLAAQYPADVRRLILVGSGPLLADFVPLIEANRRRHLDAQEWVEYRSLCEQLSQVGRDIPASALARLGALGSKSDSYDPVELAEPQGPGADQAEIYRGVWPAAARLRGSGALLAQAARIACPVLAIHGEQDPHPAVGVQEPLAARLADFRMLLLPRCGHEPWRERHASEPFYLLLEQELAAGSA